MVLETVQPAQVAFQGSSVSVSLQTPVVTMNISCSKAFWGRCKLERINYQHYILFKTDRAKQPNMCKAEVCGDSQHHPLFLLTAEQKFHCLPFKPSACLLPFSERASPTEAGPQSHRHLNS